MEFGFFRFHLADVLAGNVEGFFRHDDVSVFGCSIARAV